MITRREAILGGLLNVVLARTSTACECSNRSGSGCIVTPTQAMNMPRAAGTGQSVPGNGLRFESSGDRNLDLALAHTLGFISEEMQTKPSFRFVEADNAFASPAGWFARTDGEVLLGLSLMKQLLGRDDHPEVGLAAVCAHEFGHVVQFKRQLIGRLQGSSPTSKAVELHADFLAGWYAGRRKQARPQFPAVIFATTAHEFGDYAFGNPAHHGTPAERAAATVAGFQAAYRDHHSLVQAIEIGVAYARSV